MNIIWCNLPFVNIYSIKFSALCSFPLIHFFHAVPKRPESNLIKNLIRVFLSLIVTDFNSTAFALSEAETVTLFVRSIKNSK